MWHYIGKTKKSVNCRKCEISKMSTSRAAILFWKSYFCRGKLLWKLNEVYVRPPSVKQKGELWNLVDIIYIQPPVSTNSIVPPLVKIKSLYLCILLKILLFAHTPSEKKVNWKMREKCEKMRTSRLMAILSSPLVYNTFWPHNKKKARRTRNEKAFFFRVFLVIVCIHRNEILYTHLWIHKKKCKKQNKSIKQKRLNERILILLSFYAIFDTKYNDN